VEQSLAKANDPSAPRYTTDEVMRRMDTIVKATEAKHAAHRLAWAAPWVAGAHEFVSYPNYIIVYRRTLVAIKILNIVHSRQQYPKSTSASS
jgi:toxin ParE1/3/4